MQSNTIIDFEKIDLRDVATKLNIKPAGGGYDVTNDVSLFHCFNTQKHKNRDAHASLSIYKNSYVCGGCSISGNHLDLIEAVNRYSKEQAMDWLKSEYPQFVHGEANSNGEKYQVRFIEKNPKSKTMFAFTPDKRTPNDTDIKAISETINKYYSIQAFEIGNCKITDSVQYKDGGELVSKYSIVMPKKPIGNTYKTVCKGSNKAFVVEGITDYLTALTMDLQRNYNVLARFNKASKLSIDSNINELYIIADNDSLGNDVITHETIKADIIKTLSDDIKSRVKVHLVTFANIKEYENCKDLSDVWSEMNGAGKTTQSNIDSLISQIIENSETLEFDNEYCFWSDNKAHTIDIIKLYAEFSRRGFKLVKDNTENADSKTDFALTRINNNVIEKYDTNALCSYAIHSIAKTELQKHDDSLSKDIQTQFSTKQALFCRQAMNNLQSEIVHPLRDTATVKRLCFKDCIIELKATGKISKIAYNELPAPIYDNTILTDSTARPIGIDFHQVNESFDYYNTDRHFISTNEPYERNTAQTPFANFIKDLCTKSDGETDTARLKALISVIGYMCIDRFETVAKIIVMTENNTDGKAQGGSGKSLIAKGIGYVQKTLVIDCKDINQQHNFKYQSATKHHRNLVFDDIRPDFDFSNLFLLPTEGLTIEKKFQPPFTLKNIKVMITANQALQDFGDDSTARRRFDMEIFKIYNQDYTPENKYERFFDNWKVTDWSRYYGFVLYCVLFYMNNGLQGYESATNTYRQLLLLTDMDGIDCLRDIIRKKANRDYNESFGNDYEVKLYKADKENIRKLLIEATESNLAALSKPKVENIIRKYCQVYGIELNDNKRYGNSRFWELKGTKESFFIE